VAGLEPISASKSTAAGLAMIGGLRGEGNVTGCGCWTGGRVEVGTLECLVAGRCKGCGVWLAAGGDVAS